MKLKMRAQLVLAISVVLGLVLISSIVVYYKAADVSQKLDRFKEVRIPLMLAAAGIDSHREMAKSEVRSVLIAVSRGDTDSARASKERFEDAWKEINTAFAPPTRATTRRSTASSLRSGRSFRPPPWACPGFPCRRASSTACRWSSS
jgi:hypothetical protein